ncbi:MAG: RagB/SusD family nutrient uptake outer membrane protein [Muribaculaceae bacterium]|nr:RagB/SusD family nutrient uptake outer membrane protein [Muribaculaceae bacterium]
MKKLYILLAVLASALVSCSDSFLEKLPQGNYVDGTFYVSDNALEAATAILYNRPWFEYNSGAVLGLSQLSNDCFGPWNDPQFNTFQVTALDGSLSSLWKSIYAVVTTSNSVIEACETKASAECTPEGIARAIGEARLMRAAAYFYALRLWGKWAAKAILAKVYLCRSGWNGGLRNEDDLEMCKALCDEVCTQSGLKLLDNYEDLFKYKFNNNEESLLSMQWVPLGEWGTQNQMFSTWSFSEISGGVGCWGSPFAAVEMIQQYELSDSLRRNATFFTQFSHYPYLCIADGGYTYTKTETHIKKGAPGGPDDDNDGYCAPMNSPLNTYIIRLADTYLTYAEACLGNDEELTGGPGLEYLNKVRERARIKPVKSVTLDDIIRERRIEFCMEYSNWYDFVTWYKWKPAKILTMLSNQMRGGRYDKTTKDEDGELHYETYMPPTTEVIVTDDKMFMPYPENDVIQNPLLKAEPVSYDFN